MERFAIFVLVLLSVSVFSTALVCAGSNGAYDVEITPRISIKGPRGGGKPVAPVATGTLGDPRPPPEDRWAVIIGISDYAGEANDIHYSDDDALDMLNALINVYGYRRDHILLLISDYEVNNATRNDIIEAIDWLRERETRGNEVIFFYSGHGARGRANDGDGETIDEGIVPWEATAVSVIWDGDLKQMFSDFDTTRIIFIFDSCYSGGMTDLKASGRIIVTASTETGLAYEDSNLENGVFTYYFIHEGVIRGVADVYDHNKNKALSEPQDVTIEEAFDYAKANVRAVAPQTPTIVDAFENDLLP